MISAVSSSQFYSLPIGPRRALSSTRVKAFYAPAAPRETHYQLLGIAENGTVLEIKRAYKELARKYHPDVSAPERREEHTRRFILVREAYQTLSDPQTRALYDHNFATRDDKRMEERGWWRRRWQSQLDELQRRNTYKDSTRMSRVAPPMQET
ncbi:chaperone protein dnaJ 20, chloroplastic-like [Primulina eburnea]|uniref:chaperone protein dnaJ 20, chloroplastic-like n=1 Tax=Primulina eburnea TaxID=1245227 RepID=UPI003C6CBC40